MKVAQMQPSLKWSIEQRDLVEETGYHQVHCTAGKYKTKIFQLNHLWWRMSPGQETWSKIESNQLPFFSKAQTDHHWLKLPGEDIAVSLWFVGENTATTINQTLIFLQEETTTNQCLLPQHIQKTDGQKLLQEDYQSWKLGIASEEITSTQSWLLVNLKHGQILISQHSKPKQPTRLAEKQSSSHLSWKRPVVFHHSPYTPHWEHALWAHDCPTRNWKDRKILQGSSQRDKEQWDMYLPSLATHALGPAEPQ